MRYGLRAWFGMLRRTMYWKLTGKPMVIRAVRRFRFNAEPQDFIAMAEAVGLEVVRYWPHQYPAGRYNYLYRKHPVG